MSVLLSPTPLGGGGHRGRLGGVVPSPLPVHFLLPDCESNITSFLTPLPLCLHHLHGLSPLNP